MGKRKSQQHEDNSGLNIWKSRATHAAEDVSVEFFPRILRPGRILCETCSSVFERHASTHTCMSFLTNDTLWPKRQGRRDEL